MFKHIFIFNDRNEQHFKIKFIHVFNLPFHAASILIIAL